MEHLKVSSIARKTIADHLQTREYSPVRIFLKMGGCGMRSFGLAFEKALSTDTVIELDGITYVIDSLLLKKYGPISIESDGFSFRLSGNGIHPPLGCGTCGYGCGTRGGSRCSGVCATCEDPCPTGQRIRSRRKKRIN